MTDMFITKSSVHASRLSSDEAGTLTDALNKVADGSHKVTVAFTYSKQTDSKPRLAGEHYVEMPGVTRDAQFGQIVRVFRRKKDGALRFTIASLSRANGENPTGYTTVIPSGLRTFKITSAVPSPQEEGTK